QIFGGVAIHAIVRSFGIAAATAFITGALAMAIAVFKVGTRRTIFSFYLFIVIYLVGTFLLDQLSYFHFKLANGQLSTTSWWTGLNPFLALHTIFNQKTYTPPDLAQLTPDVQGWPWGWYLSNPAGFYTSFMFFLSFVLVSPSIVLLRRLAQSSTSLRSWVLQKLRLSSGDKTRKPRPVWYNPIAWREAKTKASAARATVLRYGFIALGLTGALALVWQYSQVSTPMLPQYIDDTSYNPSTRTLTVYNSHNPMDIKSLKVTPETTITLGSNNKVVQSIEDLSGKYAVSTDINRNGTPSWLTIHAFEIPRKLPAPEARQFLLGATIIELAVILLIVTNAAASTVTREKEDGTLDLLLSTPITSRYYIWGKLRGLVSFVLPLIAVPVLSVLFFVIYDAFRLISNSGGSTFQWIVFPEAVLVLPGMLIIVSAFAAILGMQMSLRCRTTVMAVMLSVGIVVGLCGALGWCGFQLLQSQTGDSIGVVAGAFSPFTLLTMLIDPYSFAARAFSLDAASSGGPNDNTFSARVLAFVAAWVAIGVYTAVVWTMYKSMVKNFDMTIRKQSR
ncbi:MAG TPA: ABC transporter permease subunit, partial [Tepidisphaeraceae bacterium]|nr:ABC transporter permease subunit [Tepidisphaeraceae bacterium]